MACSALFRHVHMIAHPPPTMLCAPSEHVGESMYPRFKNRGIIAPPHPLFFLTVSSPSLRRGVPLGLHDFLLRLLNTLALWAGRTGVWRRFDWGHPALVDQLWAQPASGPRIGAGPGKARESKDTAARIRLVDRCRVPCPALSPRQCWPWSCGMNQQPSS